VTELVPPKLHVAPSTPPRSALRAIASGVTPRHKQCTEHAVERI
jgi:hypothetical protein